MGYLVSVFQHLFQEGFAVRRLELNSRPGAMQHREMIRASAIQRVLLLL